MWTALNGLKIICIKWEYLKPENHAYNFTLTE